jgi:hypothetical protein
MFDTQARYYKENPEWQGDEKRSTNRVAFYKRVYRLYPAYLPKAFLAAFCKPGPFINVILPKLIIDERGCATASYFTSWSSCRIGQWYFERDHRYMTYRMDEAYMI